MISTRTIRILSIILSLMIAIGIIATSRETVLADTDATTGLTYTITDGKATVTGFTAPSGFSGALIIPATLGGATVTSISSSALKNHMELTSINIPSGVTYISGSRFDGCSNLEAINVESANTNYSSTDGVLYSKEVTQLICCPVRKTGNFTIPTSVTSIVSFAFRNCSSINSITIPSSVTNIGQAAFYYCSGLTNITIPSSVTTIGDQAFYSCSSLSSVTIPSSVTDIGTAAFYGCSSLSIVTIPSSVASIGTYVFQGCDVLLAITVDSANTAYKSVDGLLLTKDGTQLICCPAGKTGSITIPSGVTSIGEEALYGCDGLTSVTIPGSVTSIGECAFGFCDNLSAAYFLGNAPTPGDDIFYDCALDFTVYYLSSKTGFTNPWYGYPAVPFFTADVSYQTHVQDIGWQDYVSNGEVSGTSAQSKRLEGIRIKLDLEGITGGIEYRTHVQDIGWQDWVADNALSGTSGQSKRLEAIQIRLTGEAADIYDVYYRVHAQNTGWMDWAKNGESSGTAGYSYRLEAIEVKLVLKGDPAPGSTTRPFIDLYELDTVSYKTHVQDIGWQAYVSNGAVSGTSAQSKRLEAIQIKLENMPGGIEYRTHVQDYGWMDWVANDALSGTSGQSKRLEAIQIRLTGEAAAAYDIYYCVHAENTGWLDWAKNGESAGTAGFGYRLEAIQIVLVPKGGPAPGLTARAFVQG